MRVGISIAQTGPLSIMGLQALKGIRLWISELQSEGGLLVGGERLPVQLIVRDDHSRTPQTQKNITRLIDEDRVDVLLGPYSSHLTKAASEISDAHQRLLWNHGGASDEIFRARPRWVVSTITPANRYLRKLPEWIARQNDRIDRYLLLNSPKGSFASDVASGIHDVVQGLAMPLRLHSADLPDNAEDFHRLLDDVSPEVIVILGARFEQEIALLRTRPAWPKSIQHIACVGAGIREFYSALGDLSEGVIGPSQWEPPGHGAPTVGPTSDQFIRVFTETYGEPPDYVAAGAYAAGVIAEACIRQADSLQDSKVREVAHDLDAKTFYGGFQIDAVGRQIGHEMHLVRWSNGRKIVIA